MAKIGHFTRQETGFSGHLQTLTLFCEICIVPAEQSDVTSAPDYRIFQGTDDLAPEIGAAWTRTSEKAGEYLSILIDDPALPEPIRAHLFCNGPEKTSWSLHWTRSAKRDGKD